MSNVEQFLNRIMVLHVEKQNRIFELFYERYLEAVESAKRAGAFDFGVEEIRARNLRSIAEPQTLFIDTASGARTMLHELEGKLTLTGTPSPTQVGATRRRASIGTTAAAESTESRRTWTRAPTKCF